MGIAVRSNFLPSDLVDYRRDKIASLGGSVSRCAFSRYSLLHHVLLPDSIGRRERSHLNTSGCAMAVSVAYSAMNEV